MSGFVGILNLDGAPVDQELLRRLTEFMAYRGPDARECWANEAVGLGHAMLRTTEEAFGERQPCSLDGQVWITADARIDGRADLIQGLRSHGRAVEKAAPDAELILHAYAVWGEACVEHLLGDFAFAIWDGLQRKLFCARDHFGIKLFYYAQVGRSLIISNTLNCIRAHPAVSNTLNEQAIGDFLLFGANEDLATTTFADIARLLPAHSLVCSDGVVRKKRYWQLTADDEIRYRRESDYVDRFKELLETAVSDRLRMRKVGLQMTGGLDSTTIAATARDLAAKTAEPSLLSAYTIVYDRLIPDRERYYSGLAARALGIPISYLVVDDYSLYQDWSKPELQRPEPSDEPLLAMHVNHLKQLAADGHRVALSGWDGDGVLRESPHNYFQVLWKRRRLLRIGLDACRYVLSQGELPVVGLRTTVRRFFGQVIPEPEGPKFPRWLNKDFAERLNLKARWEQINSWPQPNHARRPTAFIVYSARNWAGLFESYDPGVTRVQLEMRHPLFDLRLMNYLLSLPPVPWCIKKHLLRVAMKGVLPEEVRLRPKTNLAGHVEVEMLQRDESQWVDHFKPAPRLMSYVERALIPPLARETDPYAVAANTRPLSLNYWLDCLG